MRPILPLLVLTSLLLLAGCDMLGIESASVTAEKRSAEGKAIGAACRHAGRAIEDCYTLNKKGEKASIYAGWREMDDYMRENKIEPVVPVIKPEPPKPKVKPPPADGEAADGEAKTEGDKAEAADKADKPDKGGHAKAGH
jgi:hypothetical protein